MPLVDATLDISIVPGTGACARICYKKTTDTDYTCITQLLPSNPTAISIPIQIDSESCDTIEYEGYIQGCCEPDGSTLGETPFTAIYTPPCQAYNFRCETDPCTVFYAGTGCQGLIGEINGKELGQEFYFCYNGAIDPSVVSAANAAGYGVTLDNIICCYDCVEITIEYSSAGGPAEIQYLQCDTNPIVTLDFNPIDGDMVLTRCVRRNSWSVNNSAAITVTDSGIVCTA
jgi:hypothetical protein